MLKLLPKAPKDSLQPDGFAEIQKLADAWGAAIAKDDHPSGYYTPHRHVVHSHARGYTQRVPGAITSRLHDCFSRGEAAVFVHLDAQGQKYSNLREKFPLPVELTLALARATHRLHLFDSRDRLPSVLCVDFMATLHRGGWEAVSFARAAKAAKPAMRIKHDLIRRALALVGIPHVIMSEADLPPIAVRNQRWLRIHTLGHDAPPLAPKVINRVEPLLRAVLSDGRTEVFAAARRVAGTAGLPAPILARVCYWLVAQCRWPVDLNRPVGPDYPLHFLPVT